MARNPIHAAHDQSGFSIIEILVALLLLAVISAGIGMAFVGSSKLQGRARVNSSMNAAAKRVFEYLRSHRSWMDQCSNLPANSLCTAPLQAAIPSDLLKDDSLGESVCPNSGGTYHHLLPVVQAKPIDSEVDGLGASDRDQNRADYYQLTIKVSLRCTADYQRLMQRQPPPAGSELPNVVIDTIVDPRGSVAKGTLVVEVCATTNQRDERMAVMGCRVGTGQGLKMMKCPPKNAIFDATPAEGCDRAWAWIAGTYDSAAAPSSFVHIQRAHAAFTLSNGTGTSLSSAGAGVDQRDGTYVFKNVDAGTWNVQISQLPSATGIPLEVWKQKVIPTQNSTGTSGIQVTVQPDVKSRALIPFTQSTNNSGASFKITFKRSVTMRNISSRRVPESQAGTFVPTAGYEGDQAYLEQQTSNFCAVQNARSGGTLGCVYIPFKPLGAHCIKGGYQLNVFGQPPSPTHWLVSCTRYDLFASAEYWQVGAPTTAVYDGPAVDADYGVSAAPTFRDLMAPAANCAGADATGVMNPYMVFGCVSGAYSATTLSNKPTTITIGPLSSGLNTGLWTQNGGGTYSVFDDRRDNHSALRNESVKTLPADIRSPLWVRASDRMILTQDGASYPSGTTFTVQGVGECRWRFNGGSPHIGSCDDCEPYIAPLNGQVNGCYILHRICYRRHIYYTVDAQFLKETDWWESGCVDERQACYGAPVIGTDPTHIAKNCIKPTTVGPPAVVNVIPDKRVTFPHSAVHLPSTAVGDS